jgi:co-chaperonin GroES (HSP10)
MKLSPTGKYILVKLKALTRVSAGGIDLSATLKDMKQCRGFVDGAGSDDVAQRLLGYSVLLKPTYRAEFAVTNDDGSKSIIVLAEEVVATIEEDEIPK